FPELEQARASASCLADGWPGGSYCRRQSSYCDAIMSAVTRALQSMYAAGRLMLVHEDMNNVLGQVATRALVFGHCCLADAAHCRALFDVDLVFLRIVVRIARRLGLYRRRLGVRGTAV